MMAHPGECVGIDLSTTSSAIAAVLGETPEIVPDGDDHGTMPSRVAFGSDGTARVGRLAIEADTWRRPFRATSSPSDRRTHGGALTVARVPSDRAAAAMLLAAAALLAFGALTSVGSIRLSLKYTTNCYL